MCCDHYENFLDETVKKTLNFLLRGAIQVVRGDKQPSDAPTRPYDALFNQLSMKKVDSGLGYNGCYATEVWIRIDKS